MCVRAHPLARDNGARWRLLATAFWQSPCRPLRHRRHQSSRKGLGCRFLIPVAHHAQTEESPTRGNFTLSRQPFRVIRRSGWAEGLSGAGPASSSGSWDRVLTTGPRTHDPSTASPRICVTPCARQRARNCRKLSACCGLGTPDQYVRDAGSPSRRPIRGLGDGGVAFIYNWRERAGLATLRGPGQRYLCQVVTGAPRASASLGPTQVGVAGTQNAVVSSCL
jgi:hypothetical protein